MRRRRSRGAPPPKALDQAWQGIDKLEYAVIERTKDVPVTAEQVIRWMYPDDIVDKLHAAFPHVRDVDRGHYIVATVALPDPVGECTFNIRVKDDRLDGFQMLIPAHGLARNNQERMGPIVDMLRPIYEHHAQFEKVRTVVRWLNEHATIGAARHYCPWLTSVLPTQHEFHKVDGQLFREPRVPMVEIAPLMRECGAIMAGALLCGNIDDKPGPGPYSLSVQFKGVRDPDKSYATNYTSNAFALL